MEKQKAVASFFSAVLVSSLLLLNFSVITYHVAAVGAESRTKKSETASAQKAQLSLLVQNEPDSQDPETTGSRCAIRQVIRSNQPMPALLSLAGELPVCLKGWSLARVSLSSGSNVRRNSERIAEFLHDLAAALYADLSFQIYPPQKRVKWRNTIEIEVKSNLLDRAWHHDRTALPCAVRSASRQSEHQGRE